MSMERQKENTELKRLKTSYSKFSKDRSSKKLS